MSGLGNKKDWQRRQKWLNKWSQIISIFALLIYGVVSLVVGIVLKSWWYISLSVYYLLLWYMEASITKNIARRRHRKTKLEYTRMRQIGVAVFALNFALIVIVILAIVLGRQVRYPGITIHITAVYDIIVVVLAASRVLKHGATDSPVVISSKCLNLTLAMLAILSLTSAAVVQYSASILVRRIIVGIVGGVICVINILLARYMIRSAAKFGDAKESNI